MPNEEQIKDLLKEAKQKGYVKNFKETIEFIKKLRNMDNQKFDLLCKAVKKAKVAP